MQDVGPEHEAGRTVAHDVALAELPLEVARAIEQRRGSPIERDARQHDRAVAQDGDGGQHGETRADPRDAP